MVQVKPSKEEISQHAKHLYETRIRHALTDEQLGHYLSIDVEAGDYELGISSLETALKLRKRNPEANVFTMKHGSFTTGSIRFAPQSPGSRPLTRRLNTRSQRSRRQPLTSGKNQLLEIMC